MKVKFGALMVDGRGKAGGQVVSKNRGGSYLKNKVSPSNPQTARQSIARSILASLSSQWNGLTDNQRKGWNGVAKDFGKTDIFGDIRLPSGQNLFIGLNSTLVNVGLTPLTATPEKREVPFSPIEDAVYDLTTPSFIVDFSGDELDGVTCLVYATPMLSPGRSFVKSSFRLIGVETVAIGAMDIRGLYNAKFGIPASGSNIHIKVVPTIGNGQKGVGQSFKATVRN